MAAKRTADPIPLCHPPSLARVEIQLESLIGDSALYCRATVETAGRTGVEMEALCAVRISLLTVYDMRKAVVRGMTIEAGRLLEKTGGRSGTWSRSQGPA